MSGRRRSDRALRPVLQQSPGRPGVAQRENRRRFWAAIAKGVPSEEAASSAGVSPPVGYRWFRESGGMPPKTLAPSSKPVSERYLSFAEREEIALLRAQGSGVRETARRVGRDASTISRELRRNAATRSGNLEYRATTAQWHAERAARRPKPAKLAVNTALRKYVQDRLAGEVAGPGGASARGPVVPWKSRRHGRRQHRRWGKAWSPEQIAKRLRLDFPGDEAMRISHEAIYQALYIQGRGALKRELVACLRTGRALRVPRSRSRNKPGAHVTRDVVLSERPAEADDRAVPGHWEGDLLMGKRMHAIATLVERKSRFVMLVALPDGHAADVVADALATKITELPQQLRRSLTWDQGKEMAAHARFSVATDVPVYFCDPRSPWQRGSNENTNGLLRQYFPKRSEIAHYTQADLDAVAAELNDRPRQTLGWRSPSQALDEALR